MILDAAFVGSGMKQAELGDATGISQSQVSKYLRGERVLTIEELDTLCAALGLDVVAVVREADRRRRGGS